METNEEIKEQYSELVISKGNNEEVEAIVGSNMDFSLNAARDSENQEIVKAIIDLLKQMEKEPPTEEYPEDIYTIGYLTALSRAEFEIEKLIKGRLNGHQRRRSNIKTF